ncbi:MAG: FAD-dependent oxidoreductase [Balneolaceae bacterium]|nr:FAD-dependent oxidoreductase [Balneolaceae bacterium]
MADQEHAIVIGGGFGGISAAKELRNSDMKVTIIDKNNHHLFQPLLYQVATAALSPVILQCLSEQYSPEDAT